MRIRRRRWVIGVSTAALACFPLLAGAVPALGVNTSIGTPELPPGASVPDAESRIEEAIRTRTHFASQLNTPSSVATDHTASAEAFAEYGRIGASAFVSQSIPSGFQFVFGSPADLLTSADAIAGFTDSLTIDVGGRAGEIVSLTIRTGLNASVTAAPGGGTARADAGLTGRANGQGFANVFRSTFDDRIENSTGTVEIVLGEAFDLNLSLSVNTFVGRPRDVSAATQSSASAAFGSTAGITGFDLFDLGGGLASRTLR